MQRWLPSVFTGFACAFFLGSFALMALAVSYLKDIRDGACHARDGQIYAAGWVPHIERVRR